MQLDAPPTVRQIYALAAVLCQMCDEEFPKDRAAASCLIERFRRELGLPGARLDEMPHVSRRKRNVPARD
jgi:hypothetical protein